MNFTRNEECKTVHSLDITLYFMGFTAVHTDLPDEILFILTPVLLMVMPQNSLLGFTIYYNISILVEFLKRNSIKAAEKKCLSGYGGFNGLFFTYNTRAFWWH